VATGRGWLCCWWACKAKGLGSERQPDDRARLAAMLLDTPRDCAATFSTGEAVRKPTEPPDAVECK
jgi:hypothetical protein